MIRALALGASLLAVLTPALAGDEAGPKKAEVCAACHGPAGKKPTTPETPRLAGQEYDYLVHVLIDYHKGTRVSPIMNAMAKPLTDKEIHDLASYYSRQDGLTSKR